MLFCSIKEGVLVKTSYCTLVKKANHGKHSECVDFRKHKTIYNIIMNIEGYDSDQKYKE
jgi:hypothetical protein